MKYFKTIIFLMFCTVCMCSCGSKVDEDELSSNYAGAPYSDWEQATTGSVKYLDSSTVLVSIYLEDQDALWSSMDKELVEKNLDVACKYLKEEGERYGKKVELIYNTSENPDLEYHFTYNKPFPGSASVSSSENADEQEIVDFVRATQDYIDENISVEEIMKKYNVNSVGYLIFIDNMADEACAYTYKYGERKYYYNEIAFINLRWYEDVNVNPDTYAHEILHLFGARDLYYSSKADGITREFMDYVVKKYPKDIMLGNAMEGVSWEDKITAKITDITAYYIGWKNHISELDEFPKIAAKYTATFTQAVRDDDEEIYKLQSKKIDEKQFKKVLLGKIFELGIFVLLVVSIIRDIRREKERKKLEAPVVILDEWDDI